MTESECPHVQNRQVAGFLATILVRVHQTQPIFEHGREIDKSNAYMKFEIILLTND